MDAAEIALLGAAGIFAGIANTVAGGGSLVAAPVLIFLGVPATTANATVRPAILAQNVLAVLGFARGGAYAEPGFKRDVGWLALWTLPGAAAGAFLAATRIDDATFERILAAVMIGVAVSTWRRRRRPQRGEAASFRRGPAALWFLVVGVYGGFVQAGVGFIIMAVLLATSAWPLSRVNAAKVAVVLAYTVVAVGVFVLTGRIAWTPAVALVVGQGVGGYLGSVVSLRASETVLLRAYLALLLIFAVALAL